MLGNPDEGDHDNACSSLMDHQRGNQDPKIGESSSRYPNHWTCMKYRSKRRSVLQLTRMCVHRDAGACAAASGFENHSELIVQREEREVTTGKRKAELRHCDLDPA